mgnify:FL=1
MSPELVLGSIVTLMFLMWYGATFEFSTTRWYIWCKRVWDNTPIRVHKLRMWLGAKREARRRHDKIHKDPKWSPRDRRPRTDP